MGVIEPTSFPKAATAFLAETERHLRRGDIVLSRSPTLSSWLIRFATGSTFSHAALVFLVAQPEEGVFSTFLLESTSAGVGLANFRDYIGGKNPHADVVVLRLEGQGLDDAYFKKVRGLMLDHVKSGYDYGRVVRLGLSFLFGLCLGWSKIRKGSPRSMREAISRTRRRSIKWVPPQFICSGFIQYGLVKAAVDTPGLAQSVVLKEGIDARDHDGLLAVTPEDIAISSRLIWRLAIWRGRVHEVASYATAKRLISSGRG